MKIKRSLGENIFNVFNIAFMLFMVAITLYPMLYVVFAAFSSPTDFIMYTGPLLYPINFTFESIKAAFENPNILTGYRNTIIIVVMGTCINILMTILCGYVLSRKGVMLNRVFTLGIIFTMYFHGGLIPSYLLINNYLGMGNTFFAVTIPVAINTFNMIIMRTAFSSVPESLEESAKLDGAGHLTIMWKIMVPLVVPTIAVLVLYYAVNHWESWFGPTIYLRERKLYPLAVIIREILILNDTREMTTGGGYEDMEYLGETIKYAVILISTVPILCIYPFIQRYFVKGVMVGAVKG